MMRPQVQESVTASQYDQYISLQRGKIRLSRSARPSRFSRRLILSSLSLRGLKTLYNYTLGWVLPNYDSSDAEVSLHYGWGGRQPAPPSATSSPPPSLTPSPPTAQESVVVPLNAARLIDDLFDVHGHQIFIDGG